MRELADIVCRLLDSKSTIEFRELPEDDPKQRQPDISLAKRLLDWSPEVGLQDGLVQTIEAFRGNC